MLVPNLKESAHGSLSYVSCIREQCRVRSSGHALWTLSFRTSWFRPLFLLDLSCLFFRYFIIEKLFTETYVTIVTISGILKKEVSDPLSGRSDQRLHEQSIVHIHAGEIKKKCQPAPLFELARHMRIYRHVHKRVGWTTKKARKVSMQMPQTSLPPPPFFSRPFSLFSHFIFPIPIFRFISKLSRLFLHVLKRGKYTVGRYTQREREQARATHRSRARASM